jgi:hypothetical protein
MSPEDKSRDDFLKYIDAHSDYQYFGGDLHFTGSLASHPPQWIEGATTPAATKDQDHFSQIIIASGRDPIMRIHIAVAFADGRSDFVDLEQAENTVKQSNAARAALGFADMRPPESVGKAIEQDRQDQAR